MKKDMDRDFRGGGYGSEGRYKKGFVIYGYVR